MIEIVQYVRNGGKCPFADWFDRLDHQSAVKVKRAVERMEDGNFGDHKSVGGGVFERRLTYGPGYRIYFGRDGEALVILLAGGSKTRQSKDIETARRDWETYKASK